MVDTAASTDESSIDAGVPSPVGSTGLLAVVGGFLALLLAIIPAPWYVCVVVGAVAVLIAVTSLGSGPSRGGAAAACGAIGVTISAIAIVITLVVVKLSPAPPPEEGVFAPPVAVPENRTETPPITGSPPSPVKLQPDAVSASESAGSAQDAQGNTVTFEASNVVDGNTATAWRVPGTGVGASLTFTFNQPVHLTEVAVVPGYAKVDPVSNEDRFRQNRRVEQARFTFDNATAVDWSYTDEATPQRNSTDVEASTVQMTVRASTRRAARDFTAVSEVEFYGWVVR